MTCKSVDITLPLTGQAAMRERFLGRRKGVVARPANLDDVTDQLEREVLAASENDIVAHRAGERYARRFEARPLPERAGDSNASLVDEGTYLITGGLGGLGLTLADRLAREVRGAKLVLVGRTALPDPSEWDSLEQNGGASSRDLGCIRRIRGLEAAGAEVMTLAADVTNLDEMRRGIDAVRERFGKVYGVFHAAGVVADELIQLKTDAAIERVFGPKVHGTQVLASLLEEAGAELLVLIPRRVRLRRRLDRWTTSQQILSWMPSLRVARIILFERSQ